MKPQRRHKLRCKVEYQGPVSFQNIAVTFSREKWQQRDLTQKTLYLDVTLGCQAPKPEVTLPVEQAEEPCVLDSEVSSHNYPDGDIGFETPQDRSSGEVSFQSVRINLCTIDTPASALDELQKDNRQRGRHEKKQPIPLGHIVAASTAAETPRKSSTREDTGKQGPIDTQLVPVRKSFHCSDSCRKSCKVRGSLHHHNRSRTENHEKSIKYGDIFVGTNSHTEVDICAGRRCWEPQSDMRAVTQQEERKTKRNLHLFPDYGKVATHKPPVSTHQSLPAEEKQQVNSKGKTVLTVNSQCVAPEGVYTGGEPSLCTRLGKDFSHKSVHRDTQKVSHHKCPVCGRAVIHRSELLRCQTKYSEGKPHKHNECGQTSEGSNLSIDTKNCTTGKPFECTECGKIFTRKSVLRMHQKSQTEEKPYVCTECGKAFTRKSQFLTHKGLHTGEKPSVCTECGRSFIKKSQFHMHQRSQTGENPFICSECGKVFTPEANVIVLQKIHTGERSYVCTVCGQAFADKSYLIKHQKIHTGEKPYKCSDCGKPFTWKTGLRPHQKHHMGEKHYKCRECRKTLFICKSTLHTHQKSHKEEKSYVCLECGKAFFHKSHFIIHKSIHTTEKLYRCSDCGKSFTMKSQLLLYPRIHMGEKPYRCVGCGKAFTDRSNLLAH